MVSVAHREISCSFSLNSIALSLPLGRKRKRGAKKLTKQALIRKSVEQASFAIEQDSDENDDEVPDPKKTRSNDELITTANNICSQCGATMVKRRYTFCPNKCKIK